MKRGAWRNRIKKACVAAATYRPYFDNVIDTLAKILEQRDMAQAEFDANPEVLIRFVNKNGAENLVQNPALRLINDLNRDALAYWRDLGLTPAGLRKINEKAIKGTRKADALSEALSKYAGI